MARRASISVIMAWRDLIYMAGLGFNFGKLPSFDDLAGPEAGE